MGSENKMAKWQAEILKKKNAKPHKTKQVDSDELEGADSGEESGAEEEVEEAEEEGEEEEEEAEEQEVEIIEEVVEKKKDKGQSSKSKVLTMFIFSSNQLRTDPLYTLQGGSVVSATLGPFARLEGTNNKGRATNVQRVLLPWLIAKYGMSYKNARLEVYKEMMEAIIDRDNVLDLAVPCRQLMKTYAIGFNTVVKKAKLAAGLFTFIDCLCIACPNSSAATDRGLNDHCNKVRRALTDLFTEKVDDDKHKEILRRVLGPDITFDKPILNFGQPELARLRQFGIPNVV